MRGIQGGIVGVFNWRPFTDQIFAYFLLMHGRKGAIDIENPPWSGDQNEMIRFTVFFFSSFFLFLYTRKTGLDVS